MSSFLVLDTWRPASIEAEIEGLEWKFGRSQTVELAACTISEENTGNLTFIRIAGACTTKRIDPLTFGDSTLFCNVRICQNDGSGQINVVEGVHQKWI
jgi:hypothetical protein